MKVYRVGGSVRDQLLELPVVDRDYVVTGASAEEMVASGFLPVGRDFPVFLHPQTREEYALARTERKAGRGYRGFVVHAAPEVTLEDDLRRRDLTINAMAIDEAGILIDPCGGRADLAAGVLRHVGAAFVEDPVRALRVGRFAARFDFTLAPETEALLRRMSASGELHDLVAERVWQELARALMERRPSRFFALLRRCAALAIILPEIDALFGVPQPPQHHPEIDSGVHLMLALDRAAAEEQPLEVRFALLAHDLGKAATPVDILPRHIGHEGRGLRVLDRLSQRLRVPAACAELAVLVTRHHGEVHRCREWRADTLRDRLSVFDALRRPERFHSLLAACRIDAQCRPGKWEDYPQESYLRQAREIVASVRPPVAGETEGAEVGRRLGEAREERLKVWMARYRW